MKTATWKPDTRPIPEVTGSIFSKVKVLIRAVRLGLLDVPEAHIAQGKFLCLPHILGIGFYAFDPESLKIFSWSGSVENAHELTMSDSFYALDYMLEHMVAGLIRPRSGADIDIFHFWIRIFRRIHASGWLGGLDWNGVQVGILLEPGTFPGPEELPYPYQDTSSDAIQGYMDQFAPVIAQLIKFCLQGSFQYNSPLSYIQQKVPVVLQMIQQNHPAFVACFNISGVIYMKLPHEEGFFAITIHLVVLWCERMDLTSGTELKNGDVRLNALASHIEHLLIISRDARS